jgi:hypothetical protein
VTAEAVEALRREWKFADARAEVDRVLAETADLGVRSLRAEIRRELGDTAGALAEATAVADECEERYGPAHPLPVAFVHALAVAGMIRHDRGDLDAAEVLYHQVLDAGVDEDGPGGRIVRLTRANFALLHRDWGNRELAVTLLAAAYAAQERCHGAGDLDTVRMAAELGGLYREAGDLDTARGLRTAAYAGAVSTLGADHPFARALRTGRPAEVSIPAQARPGRRKAAALAGLAAVTVLASLAFAATRQADAGVVTARWNDGGRLTPTLKDDGSELTVSWRGGTQTVVVAIRRGDGPPKVLAQLPPGTSEYTVRGVEEAVDYCVLVGALGAEDTVAPLTPVCTHRLPGGLPG